MRLLAPLLVATWLAAASGLAVTPLAGGAQEPDARSAPRGAGSLAAHLSRTPPDTLRMEQALELLDEGLALWNDGEHAEGTRLADEALALLPAVADWRPLVRAELLAAAGDTAGVRQALDALEPSSEMYRRWGWELLVDAHLEAGDTARARNEALTAGASTDAEQRAAGRLRAGRVALAMGDSAAARDLLKEVMAGEPEGLHARRAARLLDDLLGETPYDEAVALSRMLLADGAWQRAVRRLEPLLDEGADELAGDPQLRLQTARALVELNRPGAARDLLEPLLDAEHGDEGRAAALYWLGRAELGAGREARAREAFLELARQVPDSPLAEEGLILLLERLEGEGTDDLLPPLFSVGVASPSGELAAVRAGTARYLAGDFQGAAVTFEEYLEASRRSSTRQQAAYWAALARERAGEADRASELLRVAYRQDPLSFYGSFAADRLDEPLLPRDFPAGPTPTPGLGRQLTNALVRLRVHQKVPLQGSFSWELARLEEHFLQRGDAAYDFAEALLEGGFPIQGVVLGRRIHREEGAWNLRLLRIVHPFPYRETIVREATLRGLDPFFVAGLIRQESIFHPTIRSAAGAVGLMQLLPSTGREVARSEGVRFAPASLADPEVNVRLGTAFLASLVRRFDGRAEDALSAYNAGPTRIRQWRQRPEYRDPHVFMEHIPFRETRHYVKTVQQNTRIYTALYGCGDFEPCLGLSYRAAVEQSPWAGGAPSSVLAR